MITSKIKKKNSFFLFRNEFSKFSKKKMLYHFDIEIKLILIKIIYDIYHSFFSLNLSLISVGVNPFVSTSHIALKIKRIKEQLPKIKKTG